MLEASWIDEQWEYARAVSGMPSTFDTFDELARLNASTIFRAMEFE